MSKEFTDRGAIELRGHRRSQMEFGNQEAGQFGNEEERGK